MDKEIAIPAKVSLYSLSGTLISLAAIDTISKKFWFYPNHVPRWFNNMSICILMGGLTVTSLATLYPIYNDLKKLIRK